MSKLKRPAGADVILPSQPVLNNDELEDEDDDEQYEAMDQEGLTPVSEDLTILDFFAGTASIGLLAAGARKDPAETAKYAYDLATALVAERAKRLAPIEEEDA